MSTSYDVVVVGCGLMGSALARTLAEHGHVVAAWNRTPGRAEALASSGVVPVRNLSEAVGSASVVVACTSTYETTREALRDVTGWTGTTLVNVGTGTPAEVDTMQQWTAERGVDYLDGSILCYPQHIGTPEGMVLFSGPEEIWKRHEELLSAFGASVHVSAKPQAASVLDVALAGGFYVTALAAYAEAVTFAGNHGISADELTGVTEAIVELLRVMTPELARSIETGEHETDQATVEVYAAGLAACLAAMRATGQEPAVLAAATQRLAAAEAAGAGHLGFSAIAEYGTQTPA
ncbi:MAG TPA: NAD(P)-binding domain-containing protein [Nocardioides sp.]|nr:NAD(P)-binding domain-containing protein [Nocardioides sp.]